MCTRGRTARGDWRAALFVWDAPSADAAGPVAFRVTTAAGSHGGFRQNQATFAPNPDLPPPGAAAPPTNASAAGGVAANHYPPPAAQPPYGGGGGGGGSPVNVKFVIHGWLMAIGWGLFVPAGVWAVRYARAPQDAPPAKNAFVEWLRSRWFKLHWILNGVGLGFATVGFFLSYSAVEDESGGDGGHLASDHSYYGAGALLLGMYQPMNAFLRPPNSPLPTAVTRSAEEVSSAVGGKTTPRWRWEWVHRVAGVFGLCVSVVAVTSGTEAAAEWGAVKGGAAAYDAYTAWVVVVAVATAAMEVARWRERRGVAGSQSRNFVELSTTI